METKESILQFKGFNNWISKDEIIRKTLRYVYTALARFPQYVDYVRALSTTECTAFKGANPERLEKIIKFGNIEADDDSFGSIENENEIVKLIVNQNWKLLMEVGHSKINDKEQLFLSRSFPFNKIDKIRKFLKRGDL